MPESLLGWLLLPWSGATDHAIAGAVAWHGRLMVLAWGLAAPVAILLARYAKIMPGQDWPRRLDNPFWWHGHRHLNHTVGVLVVVAALLLVVAPEIGWSAIPADRYAGSRRDLHALLGWAVVAIALLQIAGAYLRGSKGGPTAPRLNPDGSVRDLRGDHYDMTPRRIWFERIHKTLGYSALLLASITLVLGLQVADAPRWMGLGIGLWWLVVLAVAIRLQRRGRCIDTYQAIWGPDPDLPGAKVEPIGWGIRRLPPNAQRPVAKRPA